MWGEQQERVGAAGKKVQSNPGEWARRARDYQPQKRN